MSADFLDSNIFIYLFDQRNSAKRKRAGALVETALREGSGVVSFQVVQETLNVITSKLKTTATTEQAREFLSKVLLPLWRVMPSEALYQRALDIRGRYRYSFYDSLVIAAALDSGCKRLYTEDLQHNQQIEGLIVTDPFRSS